MDKIIDTSYRNKVLKMLTDMDIGEIRNLDKSSPNYDRFVSTVKDIISGKIDHIMGFSIDFNSDYTKFRKLPSYFN